MAKFVLVTAYGVNSTAYASASPMLLNSDNLVFASNANTKQKQAVPSASTSINTAYVENDELNNAGQRNTYLLGEALAALVTASS